MTEAEEWKSIKGYESSHEVSSFGRIKSLKRTMWNGKGNQLMPERIMKQRTMKTGYLSVNLCKEAKVKTFRSHRLVAQTFIPNPENKKTVNHKDGNKVNNVIENLEWATHSENLKHSYDKLNRKPAGIAAP